MSLPPARDLSELPLVLTIPEVALLLRIGRSAAYEAARRGDLPVIHLGRKLRVSRSSLARLLDEEGSALSSTADPLPTDGSGCHPDPDSDPEGRNRDPA